MKITQKEFKFEISVEEIARLIADHACDYDSNFFGDESIDQIRDQFCQILNSLPEGMLSFTVNTKF
jgi:hypothetical protein